MDCSTWKNKTERLAKTEGRLKEPQPVADTHILIISHQTLHLCSRKFDKILCIYSQNLRKTKLVPRLEGETFVGLNTDRARQLVTKSSWNAHQGPGTEENGARFYFNLIPSGKPGSSLQVFALTQFHIHELLWTSTGKGICNQSKHSRVSKTWVPNSWFQTGSKKSMQNLFPYKKKLSGNLCLFLGLFFPSHFHFFADCIWTVQDKEGIISKTLFFTISGKPGKSTSGKIRMKIK